MRLARLALLAGALSPLVAVAGWAGAALVGSAAFVAAGHIAIAGPLLALAALSPRRGLVRRLVIALVVGVAMPVAGAALAFAPDYLFNADPPDPAIELRRVAASGDGDGTYEVVGLCVRHAPVAGRSHGEHRNELCIRMIWRDGVFPETAPLNPEGVFRAVAPCEHGDGYGNGIAAALPRPGVMRLEDRAGGFALIDWTGIDPVLIESRAAARPASARGPTELARRLVVPGVALLVAAPFAAWAVLSGVVAGALPAGSPSRRDWWAVIGPQLAGLAALALALSVWEAGRSLGCIGIAFGGVALLSAISLLLAGLAGMVRALWSLARHSEELADWSRQQERQQPV